MPFNAVRCLVVLALAALPFVSTVFAGEGKKPLTPAELYQVAKSSSTEPETRQAAILKLGDISETEERNLNVSEMLVEIAVTCPDPFVAKSAVKALTRLQKNVSKRPKSKYIKPLIALMKDKNALPGVRSEVAQCFSETLDKDELNDRDAFAALKNIARDKTEQNIALRGRCIEAIGSFADPDSIVMLCDMLSDNEPYIKEAAARAISVLLDKAPASGMNVNLGAVNKIVDMVMDEKLGEDLRVIVIRADAQLIAAGVPGANKGMDTIIKLVLRPEDKIVMASIEALGIIGTAQAADPLIKTYKDFLGANATNEKDVPIRRAVVRALRSVLSTQALKTQSDMQTVHKVADLLCTIVDNTAEVGIVKESAVYAMGYLYPKKFESEHRDPAFSLVTILGKRDTDPTLKAMIPDALEALTRVNYGMDAGRWLDWYQKTYPGAAARP